VHEISRDCSSVINLLFYDRQRLVNSATRFAVSEITLHRPMYTCLVWDVFYPPNRGMASYNDAAENTEYTDAVNVNALIVSAFRLCRGPNINKSRTQAKVFH
jgi:hypothetical protein